MWGVCALGVHARSSITVVVLHATHPNHITVAPLHAKPRRPGLGGLGPTSVAMAICRRWVSVVSYNIDGSNDWAGLGTRQSKLAVDLAKLLEAQA